MEHKSNWVPSARLQALMTKKGALPKESSSPNMPAHIWLDKHRALFASPIAAQRVISIVRYHMATLSIDDLRRRVAESYIEDHRVVGALMRVRNLGWKTFEALRDVLEKTV